MISWSVEYVLFSCPGVLPVECVLVSIHPGLELQGGVLPKGRDKETEEQSDEDKQGRQHNLQEWHSTPLMEQSIKTTALKWQ